jgi:hypothetical protein
VSRFLVEFKTADGPRREVYVTNGIASLHGTPLREGGEVISRGRRWTVEHVQDGDDRYVLTPVGADA